MIPRPSQTEVLAEVHAAGHELKLGQLRKLMKFLNTCEYIGNGKYVVIVLNKQPSRHPRQLKLLV